VIAADIARPDSIASNAQVQRARRGVDLDRRLSRPGDRDVASSTENGLDIGDGTANSNSVEQFRGLWHGDRRQHANDAQRDCDFGDRERVSLVRLTSLGLGSGIAYGVYPLCR
jgi:hypothetical protein